MSVTTILTIEKLVIITKMPITIPHDKPLENLATICKTIALKIMPQIVKISIDTRNAPKAPSAPTIEFKLVKYRFGSGLLTAKNAIELRSKLKTEII